MDWLAFLAFLSCSSPISSYVLFFFQVCKSQLFTMHYYVAYFDVLSSLSNVLQIARALVFGAGVWACWDCDCSLSREHIIWVEPRRQDRLPGPAAVLSSEAKQRPLKSRSLK